MTCYLLIFVTNIQTPGLYESRLGEGYLLSLHCESKTAQKLQTLLLGGGDTKVRPYSGTESRTVNALTDLKGREM
jgi:hypothetical protein